MYMQQTVKETDRPTDRPTDKQKHKILELQTSNKLVIFILFHLRGIAVCPGSLLHLV